MIFTFFASITCALCALVAFTTHSLSPCLDSGLYQTQVCYLFEIPIMFVGCWTYLLVSVWTGLLMVSQLQMVAAETSTFESLRSRNNVYIPRRILENYRRAVKNVMVFLCTGKYSVTKVSCPLLSLAVPLCISHSRSWRTRDLLR